MSNNLESLQQYTKTKLLLLQRPILSHLITIIKFKMIVNLCGQKKVKNELL